MSNQERLDRKVQQLIQQALRHTFGSQERTYAISSLISLAEQLPGSLKEDNLDTNLRTYYYDALRTTEADITKNIEKFSQKYESLDIEGAAPEVVRIHFVRWYNMILKYDCIDKSRSGKKKTKPVSIDKPLKEDSKTTIGETIADPNILPPIDQAIFDENKREQQLLLDYLRKDPDQILQNCCSQKYPHCNCWEICKRYYLQQPPEKWVDIAKALNISFGTVTSHWDRKCKPLLKTIREEFEKNLNLFNMESKS